LPDVSRIPQHFIEELIARTDLVELIGGRVPLKKAGKEYKACCPFHGEKTPSFHVVPDKQFYHCFGCGKHGTAIDFLMEHDHLNFLEAVEDLAERVGLEVPREQNQSARPAPHDSLYAMLDQAAEIYRRELKNSERAKDYFKRRGLTGDTAARFSLGYAPDAWDTVLKQLGGGNDLERIKLRQVGLIIERENASGHYDRFRDRVMFPIRDARGRTIGFGGRVLDKGEPKYLNSPETELFHKGRELYGLYEARQASRTLTRLLIVEGYMDVVRLHQAGITYAVATLGTATTPDHLQRIFRICNEVVFCFDGDRAGRGAAWRALENSLSQVREGRELKFLFLPEGHDPDSLVGEEGREAFEARLQQALPLSEYFISHLRSQVDVSTDEGRAKLKDLAEPLLNRMPEGIYRDRLEAKLGAHYLVDSGLIAAFRSQRESSYPAQAEANRATRGSSHRPDRSNHRPGVRHNLIRQSIHLLAHYPQIADKVALPPTVAGLERPGIPLLVELLEELQRNPCATTAILLERWRNHPDVGHLSKLALLEMHIPDAAGAAQELRGALEHLAREGSEGRLNQLLSKGTREGLSAAEKAELQDLLRNRAGSADGATPRT
jgi:DNA primase